MKVLTNVDFETAHVFAFLVLQGFFGVGLILVLDKGEAGLKEGW